MGDERAGFGDELQEEEEEKFDPSQHHVFVDSVDEYIGGSVATVLVELGFRVYGTTRTGVRPKDEIEIVASIEDGIASAGVVVFEQLEDSAAVKEALRIISKRPLHRRLKLIIFSSLLTWGARQVHTGTDVDEQASDTKLDIGDDATDGARAEPEEELENPEPGPAIVEEDYLLRRPLMIVYQQYLTEGFALKLASDLRERLDVYIFGLGLVYGGGEHVLQPFFRALWEGRRSDFPFSRAYIPVFNERNLGLVVRKVITTPLPEPGEERHPPYYILAEQESPNMRDIAKRFSELLADGGICDLSTVGMPELHRALLSTNLPAESTFMADIDEETVHFGSGLIESAWRVVDEFRTRFGLEPLKIMVTGPPGSPVLSLCEYLSTRVGVHVVDAQVLMARIGTEQSEFAEEVRAALEAAADEPDDEPLVRVLHRDMQIRDCRNYGWAIAGFVDSSERARMLFDISDQEDMSPHFQFMPTHVIGLDASGQELEDHAAGGEGDRAVFLKALKKFRRDNTEEANYWQFFDEHRIPGLIRPAFEVDMKDIHDFLGPRRDFGREMQDLEADIEAAEVVVAQGISTKQALENAEVERHRQKWQELKAVYAATVRRIEEKDRQEMSDGTIPLMQYLETAVLPGLVEAIQAVLTERDRAMAEPVQHLAGKLFIGDRDSLIS